MWLVEVVTVGVYFTVHQCLTELMLYGAVKEDSITAAVCTPGTLSFSL